MAVIVSNHKNKGVRKHLYIGLCFLSKNKVEAFGPIKLFWAALSRNEIDGLVIQISVMTPPKSQGKVSILLMLEKYSTCLTKSRDAIDCTDMSNLRVSP
jgi:hypothetical protein